MTFGDRLTFTRKNAKWSQDELAKKIGTSAPIIGRYEREEIKPSIEVAQRLADVLNVTIDYLITGATMVTDKKMMKRLVDVDKLDSSDKSKIFDYMDLIIRDTKTKQAYS